MYERQYTARHYAALFLLLLLLQDIDKGLSQGPQMFELTEDTFGQFTKDKDVMLVEFIMPWCKHCQALQPEWEKAAQVLASNREYILGKVNCWESGKSLCDKLKIPMYPEIRLYRHGVFIETYDGERNAGALLDYAQRAQATTGLVGPAAPLPPPPPPAPPAPPPAYPSIAIPPSPEYPPPDASLEPTISSAGSPPPTESKSMQQPAIQPPLPPAPYPSAAPPKLTPALPKVEAKQDLDVYQSLIPPPPMAQTYQPPPVQSFIQKESRPGEQANQNQYNVEQPGTEQQSFAAPISQQQQQQQQQRPPSAYTMTPAVNNDNAFASYTTSTQSRPAQYVQSWTDDSKHAFDEHLPSVEAPTETIINNFGHKQVPNKHIGNSFEQILKGTSNEVAGPSLASMILPSYRVYKAKQKQQELYNIQQYVPQLFAAENNVQNTRTNELHQANQETWKTNTDYDPRQQPSVSAYTETQYPQSYSNSQPAAVTQTAPTNDPYLQTLATKDETLSNSSNFDQSNAEQSFKNNFQQMDPNSFTKISEIYGDWKTYDIPSSSASVANEPVLSPKSKTVPGAQFEQPDSSQMQPVISSAVGQEPYNTVTTSQTQPSYQDSAVATAEAPPPPPANFQSNENQQIQAYGPNVPTPDQRSALQIQTDNNGENTVTTNDQPLVSQLTANQETRPSVSTSGQESAVQIQSNNEENTVTGNQQSTANQQIQPSVSIANQPIKPDTVPVDNENPNVYPEPKNFGLNYLLTKKQADLIKEQNHLIWKDTKTTYTKYPKPEPLKPKTFLNSSTSKHEIAWPSKPVKVKVTFHKNTEGKYEMKIGGPYDQFGNNIGARTNNQPHKPPDYENLSKADRIKLLRQNYRELKIEEERQKFPAKYISPTNRGYMAPPGQQMKPNTLKRPLVTIKKPNSVDNTITLTTHVPQVVKTDVSQDRNSKTNFKTISIKLPMNVSLATVLKNIYEHMYEYYYHTRPLQGSNQDDTTIRRVIQELVRQDVKNISRIVNSNNINTNLDGLAAVPADTKNNKIGQSNQRPNSLKNQDASQRDTSSSKTANPVPYQPNTIYAPPPSSDHTFQLDDMDQRYLKMLYYRKLQNDRLKFLNKLKDRGQVLQATNPSPTLSATPQNSIKNSGEVIGAKPSLAGTSPQNEALERQIYERMLARQRLAQQRVFQETVQGARNAQPSNIKLSMQEETAKQQPYVIIEDVPETYTSVQPETISYSQQKDLFNALTSRSIGAQNTNMQVTQMVDTINTNPDVSDVSQAGVNSPARQTTDTEDGVVRSRLTSTNARQKQNGSTSGALESYLQAIDDLKKSNRLEEAKRLTGTILNTPLSQIAEEHVKRQPNGNTHEKIKGPSYFHSDYGDNIGFVKYNVPKADNKTFTTNSPEKLQSANILASKKEIKKSSSHSLPSPSSYFVIDTTGVANNKPMVIETVEEYLAKAQKKTNPTQHSTVSETLNKERIKSPQTFSSALTNNAVRNGSNTMHSNSNTVKTPMGLTAMKTRFIPPLRHLTKSLTYKNKDTKPSSLIQQGYNEVQRAENNLETDKQLLDYSPQLMERPRDPFSSYPTIIEEPEPALSATESYAEPPSTILSPVQSSFAQYSKELGGLGEQASFGDLDQQLSETYPPTKKFINSAIAKGSAYTVDEEVQAAKQRLGIFPKQTFDNNRTSHNEDPDWDKKTTISFDSEIVSRSFTPKQAVSGGTAIASRNHIPRPHAFSSTENRHGINGYSRAVVPASPIFRSNIVPKNNAPKLIGYEHEIGSQEHAQKMSEFDAILGVRNVIPLPSALKRTYSQPSSMGLSKPLNNDQVLLQRHHRLRKKIKLMKRDSPLRKKRSMKAKQHFQRKVKTLLKKYQKTHSHKQMKRFLIQLKKRYTVRNKTMTNSSKSLQTTSNISKIDVPKGRKFSKLDIQKAGRFRSKNIGIENSNFKTKVEKLNLSSATLLGLKRSQDDTISSKPLNNSQEHKRVKSQSKYQKITHPKSLTSKSQITVRKMEGNLQKDLVDLMEVGRKSPNLATVTSDPDLEKAGNEIGTSDEVIATRKSSIQGESISMDSTVDLNHERMIGDDVMMANGKNSDVGREESLTKSMEKYRKSFIPKPTV